MAAIWQRLSFGKGRGLARQNPLGKPAVMRAGIFQSRNVKLSGDFGDPRISRSGALAKTELPLKECLEERGCQMLSDKKLGQPDGVAWLEFGSIDSTSNQQSHFGAQTG